MSSRETKTCTLNFAIALVATRAGPPANLDATTWRTLEPQLVQPILISLPLAQVLIQPA